LRRLRVCLLAVPFFQSLRGPCGTVGVSLCALGVLKWA